MPNTLSVRFLPEWGCIVRIVVAVNDAADITSSWTTIVRAVVVIIIDVVAVTAGVFIITASILPSATGAI